MKDKVIEDIHTKQQFGIQFKIVCRRPQQQKQNKKTTEKKHNR